MKLYVMSFGAGILVGIVYALLQVRSPAPPTIALIGLLGMLVGEQVVPTVKRVIVGEPVTMAWFRSECAPKISGVVPPKDVVVAELRAADRDGAVNHGDVSR